MVNRERLYTQNLSKRINFVCKNCNSNMNFMRGNRKIVIKCSDCGLLFSIQPETFSKSHNVIRWNGGGDKDVL